MIVLKRNNSTFFFSRRHYKTIKFRAFTSNPAQAQKSGRQKDGDKGGHNATDQAHFYPHPHQQKACMEPKPDCWAQTPKPAHRPWCRWMT